MNISERIAAANSLKDLTHWHQKYQGNSGNTTENRGSGRGRIPKETIKAFLNDLDTGNYKSYKQLGRKYKVCWSTVRNYAIKFGVEIKK